MDFVTSVIVFGVGVLDHKHIRGKYTLLNVKTTRCLNFSMTILSVAVLKVLYFICLIKIKNKFTLSCFMLSFVCSVFNTLVTILQLIILIDKKEKINSFELWT